MSDVDATSVAAIGGRVRALREAMGLSLRDLAERCGVSAPMLSQVERGETSPTLQIATRIAAGLDLRLSQLLRLDEDGAVTIVRTRERRRGPHDGPRAGGVRAGGHSYEVLTPPLPGQRAELSRHTLAAGAATGGPGDPPMHEPGSRETALVESGSVVLHCDGATHELSAGDCVTFDADLPHHFENPGTEEASLLAVVSAGLRRS
ncbi:MAG TPA: cupin domain-containing protein [Conexibacter sp.]|nr:cupin domain-containing protein [Conexibacter sp.]